MPKRYSVVKPVTLPRNMLTSLERDCALSCPSCSPKVSGQRAHLYSVFSVG